MMRLETEEEAGAEDRTLGGGSTDSEDNRDGEEKDVVVDGFGYEKEESTGSERGVKTINFDANGHATGNGSGIQNQYEKDKEKDEEKDGDEEQGLSRDDLNDTRTNPNNAATHPPLDTNYTESKTGRGEREQNQSQGQEQEQDLNLIKWAPNDPENPRNWSTAYKSWVTFQLGMLALGASLGSSIISPAGDSIAEDLGVSREVVVLVISLYIIGFAFGPLLWAPISEIWGRRWSMLPPMFCLGLFSIGTATSKTPTALFITRFFGGVFGSAPVSNVSACLGDIWEPKARGIAVTFYAVAVVGGPTLGPIIGAALTINPQLGWRWTEYILAIWVFVVTGMGTVFLPEVYAPVLLKRRASVWRKETGNQAFWHPHERVALDIRTVVTKHFSRPLLMLVSEPMVTCIAFYASFVYALLYLTLEVFPIVFRENRNWALLTSTLPFLGLFIGVLCAVVINLGNAARYARIADAANGKPVPEARLPPMALGGILFTIGLFTFGWTASPQIPWPACVVVTIFIGAGFNTIFQQCINFLVDTYGSNYAASAVSANTFLRSVLAAAFPLVAKPMFGAMGVGPAMSVLGGVAALAVPVPFLFMRFGKSLRRRSRFAPFEG